MRLAPTLDGRTFEPWDEEDTPRSPRAADELAGFGEQVDVVMSEATRRGRERTDQRDSGSIRD